MSRDHSVRVTVHGEPQTKGSTRAIAQRRKDGSLIARVFNDNARTKQWQQSMAWAAQLQRPIRFSGPVALDVTFRLARPQKHVGPDAVSTRPDLDKLVRTVLDALSGVCYHDDGQVAELTARKLYAPPGPLVEIVVRPL
jgi:crossover junction endodeoxyribonuclease RusA